MDKPGNKATLMDGDFIYMRFALVASGKRKKVALRRGRKEAFAAGGAVARRQRLPRVRRIPQRNRCAARTYPCVSIRTSMKPGGRSRRALRCISR
jgi:hypothetical protein